MVDRLAALTLTNAELQAKVLMLEQRLTNLTAGTTTTTTDLSTKLTTMERKVIELQLQQQRLQITTATTPDHATGLDQAVATAALTQRIAALERQTTMASGATQARHADMETHMERANARYEELLCRVQVVEKQYFAQRSDMMQQDLLLPLLYSTPPSTNTPPGYTFQPLPPLHLPPPTAAAGEQTRLATGVTSAEQGEEGNTRGAAATAESSPIDNAVS